MSSNFDSIFMIDITKQFGPEYVDMFNDIARMATIQIFIQLMLYTINPETYEMFNVDFILLLLFVILGVCAYWLIFKKIVAFK